MLEINYQHLSNCSTDPPPIFLINEGSLGLGKSFLTLALCLSSGKFLKLLALKAEPPKINDLEVKLHNEWNRQISFHLGGKWFIRQTWQYYPSVRKKQSQSEGNNSFPLPLRSKCGMFKLEVKRAVRKTAVLRMSTFDCLWGEITHFKFERYTFQAGIT